MQKLEWRDVSSFSRDTAPEDRIPNSFELKTTELRVCLFKSRWGKQSEWFVSCYNIGLEQYSLGECDLREAKKLAIQAVKDRLRIMMSSFKKEDQIRERN